MHWKSGMEEDFLKAAALLLPPRSQKHPGRVAAAQHSWTCHKRGFCIPEPGSDQPEPPRPPPARPACRSPGQPLTFPPEGGSRDVGRW